MSFDEYTPLHVRDFLRVIANPVLLNTAPNKNLHDLPEFKSICKTLQNMAKLPASASHRLPQIITAALHFLQKAEHYDYFNLYGTPFITSFAGAIFGWNIRFLLSERNFPARRILITGETGTGKEQVARLIGEIISGYNQAGFMSLNAANLSETLTEAELFGYSRGAFTGADKSHPGILRELRSGGVLFLDEITETPPGIQAKLLRLLETGEYRPVGSSETRHAKISYIAATNRSDPFQYPEFRNDILYRLSEATIELPSLRSITSEKDQAIGVYDHLIISTARDMSQGIDTHERQIFLTWVTEWSKRVARDLADRWSGYPWPGNIRECRNAIRRIIMNFRESDAVLSNELLLEIPQITDPVKSWNLKPLENETENINLKQKLETVERSCYQWAAGKAKSIEGVAGKLGVTRQTASRKMKAYGIRTDPINACEEKQ